MLAKKFVVVFFLLFISSAIFIVLISVHLNISQISSLPFTFFPRTFFTEDASSLTEKIRLNYPPFTETLLQIGHKDKKPDDKSGSIASMKTSVSLQHQQKKTFLEKPSLLAETKKKNLSRLLLGSSNSFKASTPDISTANAVEGSADWGEGTFCHQFLANTFQQSIPVCGNSSLRGSVNCFGSPYSQHMGTCVLENVVISPRLLAKAMLDADRTRFIKSEPSIALLGGCGTECLFTSLDKFKRHMEAGDYVWHVVNKVKEEKPQNASVCERWIEEDVFLFTAHRFHIYFRFLDYFNVHKMVQDFKRTLSPRYSLIRISGSDDYHFPKFDQLLFPEVEVQALDHLDDVRTCFKKVILVPKSYASVLYQCKVAQPKCTHCNGWDLMNTQFNSFRARVLQACSLSDSISHRVTHGHNLSIIFVSRQPYLRNKNDKKNRFERVLDNEAELLLGLKHHLNVSVVQSIHLEGLGLCEQVRIAHNSDIFMGVHGAGLVHLWWLRKDSLAYEMIPQYEMGNPTFRTLARLSGRRYDSTLVGGGFKTVHAQVSEILKKMDKYFSLSRH